MTIRTLVEQLESASDAYYNSDPLVSDAEYDRLVDDLRRLSPTNPFLSRIGAPPAGRTIEHTIPVGSLDKIKDRAEFDAWCANVLSVTPTSVKSLVIQPKLDGITIVLYYRDGRLENAVLRGDGRRGEPVTKTVSLMSNVKQTLPDNWSGCLRGEIVLPLDDFRRVFAPLGYKNARNTVAGKTRDQDADPNLLKLLQVIYFDYVPEGSSEESTIECHLAAIENMGLKAIERQFVASSDEAWGWYEHIAQNRANLDFEIDGIVVKANSTNTQNKLGVGYDLRPAWAKCVKFEAAATTTRVVGCQVTLGHTGRLIPTADLDPIELGGVTIDSVLLNNWNTSSAAPSAAHVAIGDIVTIARQGDIIPKIIRVVLPVYLNPQDGFIGSLKDFEEKYGIVELEPCDPPIPGTEHCSSEFVGYQPYIVGRKTQKINLVRPTIEEPKEWQGHPTTRIRRGKTMASTFVELGSDHASIRKQKVKHWIGTGKKGIGIRGVGDGVLDALTDGDNPLVKTPADLYRLSLATLANLTIGTNSAGSDIRFGESRAQALLDQIEANRTLTLAKFLGGLGIDLLGTRRVEIIAKETGLNSLDDWLDDTKLAKINGDTIRTSITQGILESKPIIEDLLAAGVVVLPYGQKQSTPPQKGENKVSTTANASKFAGKSFCFTGTRECLDEVEALGGEIKSGVSKGLTYLVQKSATSQSNKTKKADEYGVKVISIDTLKAALAGERDLP